MKIPVTAVILLWLAHSLSATEYHVSKEGSDRQPGDADRPFLTIQAAANVSRPGDNITVHAGVYRERVDPPRGGVHDLLRIVFRAAEGERVVIKGSEIVEDWEHVDGTVWKATLPNTLFGTYNPYEDPSFSLYAWYGEAGERNTVIWANFQSYDPNEELVEINVREACFYPRRSGINFITVQGFEMSQAATQWAAPTAEQIGLIGTHWSRGWIIENNVVSNSKSVGITLGKDRETGHNVWMHHPVKDGATHYNEVIFKALEAGWSKEKIGSHIVRNNEIFDCGQAGIVGSLGAVFSTIRHNHIHHIYTKRTYSGAEMAGIKIHPSIDMVIEHNLIHDAFIGIWLDWMAQGTRVTRNILFDNTHHDFFSEVNHGPYMVDHNFFLSESGLSIQDASEGGAYIHNLFAGKNKRFNVPNRVTPYHRAHSTKVMCLRNIRGGDNRFYNNLFIQTSDDPQESYTDRTGQHISIGYGLRGYDEAEFPSFAGGNVFYNGAPPGSTGEEGAVTSDFKPVLEIEELEGRVVLRVKIDGSAEKAATQLVTTALLGSTLVSEAPYDQKDGKAYRIDTDFLHKKRADRPSPGPFESVGEGWNEWIIWNQQAK